MMKVLLLVGLLLCYHFTLGILVIVYLFLSKTIAGGCENSTLPEAEHARDALWGYITVEPTISFSHYIGGITFYLFFCNLYLQHYHLNTSLLLYNIISTLINSKFLLLSLRNQHTSLF
jgi:hypothetical protein